MKLDEEYLKSLVNGSEEDRRKFIFLLPIYVGKKWRLELANLKSELLTQKLKELEKGYTKKRKDLKDQTSEKTNQMLNDFKKKKLKLKEDYKKKKAREKKKLDAEKEKLKKKAKKKLTRARGTDHSHHP